MDELSMEISKAAIAAMNRKDEEIAKLREQLATLERNAQDEINRLEGQKISLEQRAEAAEAKLKAASEQQPAYWVYEWFGIYDTACEETWNIDVSDSPVSEEDGYRNIEPLYAAPVPPVYVQELQTKLDTVVANAVYLQSNQAQRIAELERKVEEWKSAAIEREKLCVKVETAIPDMLAAIAQAREEGRKAGEEIATHERVAILRNGREEGRKEAVPDVDWLSNVIRSVDGKHDLSAGTLAEKIVEAIRKNTGEP